MSLEGFVLERLVVLVGRVIDVAVGGREDGLVVDDVGRVDGQPRERYGGAASVDEVAAARAAAAEQLVLLSGARVLHQGCVVLDLG